LDAARATSSPSFAAVSRFAYWLDAGFAFPAPVCDSVRSISDWSRLRRRAGAFLLDGSW